MPPTQIRSFVVLAVCAASSLLLSALSFLPAIAAPSPMCGSLPFACRWRASPFCTAMMYVDTWNNQQLGLRPVPESTVSSNLVVGHDLRREASTRTARPAISWPAVASSDGVGSISMLGPRQLKRSLPTWPHSICTWRRDERTRYTSQDERPI